MTSEKRPDSLAEQAAAWVPPWERPTGTASPEAPVESSATEPAAESSAEPAAESFAEPSVEPLAESSASRAGDRESASAEERPQPSVRAAVAEPDEAVGVPEDAAAEAEGAPAAAPKPGGAGRQAATLALIDEDELRGALEAILLVVDEPVTEILLAQVLEQPTERVAAMLDRLSGDYTAAGHGFELRRAAGGWRLYTRPEYAAYVERFVLDGQSVRLTQAALETLAVVAYKQPVTRSRISAIRGVNCDGVIRTLVTRGLVEECGTEPESGAFLYRTTTLFLEKLGLDTVAQLPPLAPFLPDDVEEIADAPR
ncbi:SMC-Scp complex subunit ScpB [Plantactinospora sp. BC1]|uniref:SMC-Scp complex subunit ScpB n=1 Tax=Plantactinospora sp. BC1 TaxID=2108470 RepID=UPI000D17B8B6|nr:SMC-Scp complex subunit ScpB [Plantactinospora sp. BC1]AVT33938.1 SMC-Scp complex subunit ScpB [Plantactinospora sp. BC1]